ncbi:MAG: hypothetical protein L6R39_006042, partial [Caloplaca ligustica]
MDSGPSHTDKTLLDRLNALKQSSVSFKSTHLAEPEDVSDLAARFSKLNATRRNDIDSLTTSIAEAPTNSEGAPPSPTVEELLADLPPEEQWQLDRDETTQIKNLLEEAKEALPSDSAEGTIHEPSAAQVGDAPDQGEAAEKASMTSSANDDEEAANQLQRILDELSVDASPPRPEGSQPSTDPTPAQDTDTLGLPSVPLDLPSAPTTIQLTPPSSKPKSQEYQDADIDS